LSTRKSFIIEKKEDILINKEELKLINRIKIVPLVVVVFFFIITYVMIENSNKNFENELLKIKKEALNQKKSLIYSEVNKVFEFINNERELALQKLKNKLKQRVYTAHTIATSIYEANKNKSKEEIERMITHTLKNIRFDDKRGYFFIIEMSGKTVLHPSLPTFEKKDVLNVQNKRKSYPVQEIIKIIKEKNEGYHTWWWTKTDESKKEYKKLGFNKYFEPFDWFISTGEYIADYEKQLKQELLTKIQKIRYGKNGYIFVGNEKGISLSHINKKLIGTNILYLKDAKGSSIVENIIKVAKEGGGYLEYDGIKMPSSGKIENKISYVQEFRKWNWYIGTGVYTNEIETLIHQKRVRLKERNKKQIEEMIWIALFTFFLMFMTSLLFARDIKRRFEVYKKQVDDKSDELKNFNNELEVKVQKRTLDLENSNTQLNDALIHLKASKDDLISFEKMATLGELVSSITHEVQTPLGVSITCSSHIKDLTNDIYTLYNNDNISEMDFEEYLNDIKELSRSTCINLNNAKQLLNSFKNVAVDQVIEDKREFYIKGYLEEVLLALKSTINRSMLKVKIECNSNIKINSYPGYWSQILTNLINNSILHGFDKNEKGQIHINVLENQESVILTYKDDGKGISAKIREDIFNQYFTTKRGKGGTGLGLYIIKTIVNDKLKGEIEISDNQKKGVKFTITIAK